MINAGRIRLNPYVCRESVKRLVELQTNKSGLNPYVCRESVKPVCAARSPQELSLNPYVCRESVKRYVQDHRKGYRS